MRILLLLLFLFSGFLSTAQDNFFSQISTNQGLSQGMILDILQDRSGYMWFSTKDGLNRYDGYSIEIFAHEPRDSFSIAANDATFLFEDSRGWLWVGTSNSGLSVYDGTNNRFLHLKVNNNRSTLKASNTAVVCITEDSAGRLWIGTGNGILILEIPNTLVLSRVKGAGLDSSIQRKWLPRTKDRVEAILNDTDTVFWSTKKTIYKIPVDQKTPMILIDSTEKAVSQNTTVKSVTQLHKDKFGALWLIQPHDLVRIKAGKKTIFHFSLELFHPQMGFTTDHNGDFLIGHKSLNKYTLTEDGILPGDTILNLNGMYCSKIFIDRSGLIWMGTNGFGVLKYNPAMRNFGHVAKNNSIYHMMIDDQQRLWYWSQQRLNILDLKTRKPDRVDGLPSWLLEARQVYPDKSGSYWFHFPQEEKVKKLVRWNPDSRNVSSYPYTGPPHSSTFMFEDNNQQIWFSTNNNQLQCLNPETGIYSKYSVSDWMNLGNQPVTLNCMLQDANRRFWVGTSHGLLSFEMKAGSPDSIQWYKNESGTPSSLSNDYILHILQDPKDGNCLWIGTKGGGLNKLDILSQTFSAIRQRDGLPNDVIYGILSHRDKLWLSTNRGLAVYTPVTGTTRNFTVEEGLQDNEFNSFSFCQAGDSLLVFGGINGINIFNPDLIQPNKNPPGVAIREVLSENKQVTYQAPGDAKQGVIFSHQQDQITFSFAALDYTAPEKNEFKYRLTGIDAGWTPSGTRHEVIYSNLSPGTYQFEVLGTNNSGLWSERPAVWTFTILRPWWQMNWAYALYILILGAVLYWLYLMQVRKIEMRNNLNYEKREAERLAELDQLKTNFYSNITHEFRTPLTLILEPVRQMVASEKEATHVQKLKLVEKNSKHLLNLVNQLLDMSKIEGGYMKIENSIGNIVEVVEDNFNSFRSLAEKKGIEMQLVCPEYAVVLKFDKQKLELILNNLLSNAVKFTPEGGDISLSLEIADVNAKQSKILIRVFNSGDGIPQDQKERIFDRFYQVSDNKPTAGRDGTGIGLALTKELVALMGGKIGADTEDVKGIVFSVELLLAKGEAGSMDTDNSQNQNPADDYDPGTYYFAGDIPDSGTEHILVIEDNPDLRKFICDTLRNKYRIIEAENGSQGIDKAIEFVPDLVVSDVMMPEKDGFEVCETIKNNSITSHIPVMLLTAKSAFESRMQGLKTGADDYLNKPFHTEELLLRIHNLIESRKLLREKYAQEWLTDDKDSEQRSAVAPGPEMEFIEKLHEIIETDLDNDELTTDEIARRMFLSRVQLHRKIKAITGQSTTEFVRNFRLDKARFFLLSRSGNVNEISSRVGISNRNYFTKSFKERFGVLPSEL